MLSEKWRQLCIGLNVLKQLSSNIFPYSIWNMNIYVMIKSIGKNKQLMSGLVNVVGDR